MDSNIVPVITGFIGQDENGHITTLGRGGSDLSSTIFGSAFPVDEIQVWKDVDGIMTADPRLISAATPVECVTYEEAAELAFFGAEVLHPIAMMPAIKSCIPVRVKNSYNPSAVGTVIQDKRDKSNTLVTAITSKSDVKIIDVVSTRMLGQYGFLSKVFTTFEECGISVDVVASSDVSLSMTLDKSTEVKSKKVPHLPPSSPVPHHQSSPLTVTNPLTLQFLSSPPLPPGQQVDEATAGDSRCDDCGESCNYIDDLQH